MKNLTLLITAFSIIMTLFWTGCKKDSSPDTETFIIEVDSIVHPDTINFGENLDIKFYGYIGPDGCYAFDKLVPEYTTGTLTVTCYGIHTFEDICTQAIVYMNGSTLQVSEMPIGSTELKIIQPDGSSLSHDVFVKE